MNSKFKRKFVVASFTVFFAAAFIVVIVLAGKYDFAKAFNFGKDIASEKDDTSTDDILQNTEITDKPDEVSADNNTVIADSKNMDNTEDTASDNDGINSQGNIETGNMEGQPDSVEQPDNTQEPDAAERPDSMANSSDNVDGQPGSAEQSGDITDLPDDVNGQPDEGGDKDVDTDNTEDNIDSMAGQETEFPADISVDEQLLGLFSLGYDAETIEQFIKEQEKCDFIIPKVQEFMNIRKEASSTSELIGRLKVKSYGVILERGEEFTKIQSGEVVGYVSNAYLYFDEDVWNLLEEWDAYRVKVIANRLNIRKAPKDGEILYTASAGETFTFLPRKSVDGWYAVEYNGEIAYMSAQYCETYMTLQTAITMEQVRAEEYAAKLAKALEEAKKHKPSKVNRASISLSDEEIYLMAAVVCMEAMVEPYEGKLAVANVIINRMLDGYWGDTVTEVIYAPGQFTGVSTGVLDRCYGLVNEDCKRAVIEALAGNNNIGDFMYFISLPKAKYEAYTKYYILGNHCFYERVWK